MSRVNATKLVGRSRGGPGGPGGLFDLYLDDTLINDGVWSRRQLPFNESLGQTSTQWRAIDPADQGHRLGMLLRPFTAIVPSLDDPCRQFEHPPST